ncbi:Assimilatory nitrate reductase electron transfer subunit [Neomoorella carbonis]
MRYLILGNSAAGVTAAGTIRRADPAGEITIVGDEPYPYYARVLTSYYLGGLVTRDRLWLAGEEWYRRQGVKLLTGRRAVAVDTGSRRVGLDDGRELPYDRLLVATGASPQQIDIPGSNLAGVFTLRTLDDAVAIRQFARPGGQAVVIGGGLVGIKAAEGLHARGLQVRLVVSSGRLLSQALDDTGAELVRRTMANAGFTIHLREDVVALEGREKVTAAVLRSGVTVPADVVVVGKGVRPNVAFLRGSGIKVDRGILVNEYLATNIPGVYAAGDVAQAYDYAWQEPRLNAIWGNAVEQGRLAGFNMAGHHTAYCGGIGRNSLVVNGLGVISGGIVNPPGEGYQVVTRLDERRSYYRKAVLQGRRLVGMVAVGPPGGAGGFQTLIGREVKDKYIASFLDGSFTWSMVGR